MPEEIAILFGLTIAAGTLISLAWIVTGYFKTRVARGAEDPAVRQQLEDMRGRLESVEERLDFAERLLAKQRERPALGGDR